MTSWHDRLAPSLEDLHALARAARDALPRPFRDPARNVILSVEEIADEDTLATMGIEDPFSLTGLYEGIPMTEKSLLDAPLEPDRIRLFRAAILDEWVQRGDVTLGQLVAHVYVHELAHHFGWSDSDIARIDRWWE